MTKYRNYSDATIRYDAAIGRLKDNLLYMIDKDLSPKLIKMQELTIFSLEKFKIQAEAYIEQLEMENHRLAKGKIEEIEKLKQVTESLEAVCIIHGILDFPCWMAKGNRYLVQEAVRMYHTNELQIPDKLMTYFKGLSNHEQTQLDLILYKGFYEKQEELKKEMDALKKKIDGQTEEKT